MPASHTENDDESDRTRSDDQSGQPSNDDRIDQPPSDDRIGQPPIRDQRSTDDDPMVVFEFTVPTEEFVLARPLREFPDVVVELEQLVPTDGATMPYLWANGGASRAFREAVAADPDVDRIRKAATFEAGALYRLDWEADDDGFFHRCVNTGDDIAVLQAEANDDEWQLKLRFPSRDELTDFQAFYDERGVDVRVVRLYDLSEPKRGQYNITEKQRDALVLAMEMGHFEIPREATLEDVADELGISARSLSERLRRGQTNLVSNTLTVGQPTGIGLGEH